MASHFFPRVAAMVVATVAALPVAFAGGVVADGATGSGPRPGGQLLISNGPTGGHAIATFEQSSNDEESAIESVGVLADGALQQQGAQFWRWIGGDNSRTSFESSWATHLTAAGTDYTPLVLLGRNSVKLCGGSTAALPWQISLPPTSWVDVRCPQRVAGYMVVGPNLNFDRHPQVGLTVEGRLEVGDTYGGYSNHSLQMGYSPGAGAAFLQSYNVQAGVFMPLIIAASDVTMGYSGQKIGFYGAIPVARPAGTCSASDGTCLRMIADALAALGLASIKVAP